MVATDGGVTTANPLEGRTIYVPGMCPGTAGIFTGSLKALGIDDDLAHASLRFTVGRFTTEAEVDFAAARVAEVVTRLRAAS